MTTFRLVGFVTIICWGILSACGSSRNIYIDNKQLDAQAKTSPAELKEDLRLLKKILEANHPGLYWYTPKDSIDWYFNTAINSITDSLTEFRFRNKVAWVLSNIRCGHTSVRFSKSYSRKLSHIKIAQFPLALKTWGDSLVVVASAFNNDSVFKRGTIITSINGRSNRMVLDSMFRFISTDGYSDNFKSQVCSINFPGYYFNAFGPSDKYTIGYIDSTGLEKTAVLNQYDPKTDTLHPPKAVVKKQVPAEPVKRKEEPSPVIFSSKSLRLDTTNSIAYMRLATFSNGRLKKFFRRSFRKIRDAHIKNLVIDLRENGGGNIGNSISLQKYLAYKPFKVADTVASNSKNIAYKKYIRPGWVYWMAMQFTTRKKEDGRAHFGYYENHLFQPNEKNHFDGQIYFLQGGFTFSASTMLISSLKGQQNVTVVGEETGGGNYGNSAVYLPTVVLPNSHLRITMPLYRVVLDNNKEKNGHGVMPDILSMPNSAAIKQNVDVKLQTVIKIIKDRKTSFANKKQDFIQ